MMVGWLVGWGLFGSLSILKKSSGGPIEEEGKRRDALLCRRIEDLMRCFRSFVAQKWRGAFDQKKGGAFDEKACAQR